MSIAVVAQEKLTADIKGLNIEGIINALEKHHQLLTEQK